MGSQPQWGEGRPGSGFNINFGMFGANGRGYFSGINCGIGTTTISVSHRSGGKLARTDTKDMCLGSDDVGMPGMEPIWSVWLQMGQIWDFFRSDFSTFWRGA